MRASKQVKFLCPHCGHTWLSGQYKCQRCGHEWIGRNSKVPRDCPNCHNSHWHGNLRPLRHCYRCGYEWRGYDIDKQPKRCHKCFSSIWYLETLPERKTKPVELLPETKLMLAIFGDGNISDSDADYKQGIREALLSAMETLTQLEREVLILRFGFRYGYSQTLEQVSKPFCVTRERIRQIEAKALRKLRHPLRTKYLRDFIN